MLRFTITWDHGSSSVLGSGALTINLTAPGQARPIPPHTQSAGRMTYELDDALNGQDLQLSVRVAYNNLGSALNTRGVNAVEMDETLHMQATSPRLDFHNTAGHWSGRHDPRLSFAPGASAPSASGTAHLQINLDFLDITATLSGAPPSAGSPQEAALDQLFRQSESHGKRLRILRHAGGAPHLWAAYVSSHVPHGARSVGVVVFFTPLHGDQNQELADANHTTPLRYLSNRQPPHHFGYTQHDGAGYFLSWQPDCRYMDQVENSGKPIVLLMPYYSASDFGGAQSGQLLAMVRSALVCLYSGGPVEVPPPAAPAAGSAAPAFEIQRFLGQSASGTTMSVSRLAVAGFSAGGAVATWAWQHNQGEISEVYLMDPATGHYDVRSYTGAFGEWLQGQHRARRGLIASGERLCLLGGDYLSECQSVAQNVPESVRGSVHVRPASADFFYTGREYIAAFATNTTSVETTSPSPQLLSDVGSPVSPLSARTGIQIDRAHVQDRRLAIVAPSVPGTGFELIVNHSPIELAAYVGLARGWYTNSRLDPLTRPRDFAALTHNIQHNASRHDPRALGAPGQYARRHQWPAFGGEDEGGQFTGYLRICLQRSAF